MSDQLFSWPGKETDPPAPPTYLEVKLRRPWVLIAKTGTRPAAHLPHRNHPNPHHEGSTFAQCNDKSPIGRRLEVDGEPMVPVCPNCYILAARGGLL